MKEKNYLFMTPILEGMNVTTPNKFARELIAREEFVKRFSRELKSEKNTITFFLDNNICENVVAAKELIDYLVSGKVVQYGIDKERFFLLQKGGFERDTYYRLIIT